MSSEFAQELEKHFLQISTLVGVDKENLKFEFEKNGDVTLLRLITINPRHKQSFVYHTSQGFGELDALQKMQDYIVENKMVRSTYTIQWALDETNELNTSYFRGKNIYEVLDKFYYGKDISTTTIFSISLNPIS